MYWSIKKTYTIANLYIHSKSRKCEQLNVFRLLQEYLQQFRLENMIISEDLNFYLDPKLDKLDTMTDSHDNPEYRQDILPFLDTENLIDI